MRAFDIYDGCDKHVKWWPHPHLWVDLPYLRNVLEQTRKHFVSDLTETLYPGPWIRYAIVASVMWVLQTANWVTLAPAVLAFIGLVLSSFWYTVVVPCFEARRARAEAQMLATAHASAEWQGGSSGGSGEGFGAPTAGSATPQDSSWGTAGSWTGGYNAIELRDMSTPLVAPTHTPEALPPPAQPLRAHQHQDQEPTFLHPHGQSHPQHQHHQRSQSVVSTPPSSRPLPQRTRPPTSQHQHHHQHAYSASLPPTGLVDLWPGALDVTASVTSDSSWPKPRRSFATHSD